MPAAWPPTLQQKVNEAGFSHEIGDTTLRSEMDVGPAKVRRRFTKSVDRFTTSINLTTSEYNTFYYFYDTTINGGVGTFTFNHPITGVATTFRFAGPPSIRSLGGGNFQVSMTWEKLP